MPIDVGRAIRIIREAKELSLQDIATKASISASYMSLIEGGRRSPSMDALLRLAKALDVPEDFLVMMSVGAETHLQSGDGGVDRLIAIMERLRALEDDLKDAIGH